MPTPEFVDVDPRSLRLPNSRRTGTDPEKLARQIARFGSSTVGMPHALAYRGADGELMIVDGVTRATRIAKLLPAQLLKVEVIGKLPISYKHLTRLGDTLP